MRFYGVEPGSVFRCEDEFHIVLSCPRKDFLCFMRTKIITDDIKAFSY